MCAVFARLESEWKLVLNLQVMSGGVDEVKLVMSVDKKMWLKIEGRPKAF